MQRRVMKSGSMRSTLLCLHGVAVYEFVINAGLYNIAVHLKGFYLLDGVCAAVTIATFREDYPAPESTGSLAIFACNNSNAFFTANFCR